MSVTHLLSPADILWKILEDYGHDAVSIFKAAGIERKMLLNPDARIPHIMADNLWSNVIDIIEDPCFGIRGVKYWHPSHFNALGYAWLASSTLRQALERSSRYAHLFGEDRENRIEDTDIGLTVTLSSSLELPAFMDLTMATMISACRLNYGESLNPVAVHFIHPEPNCSGEFYAYFKTPVIFNADEDSFTLSADVVDQRLPIGNPQIAELNDQYIIRYLAELGNQNLVQRVKGAIIDMLPSGGVCDEKVARKLNMSTRSLQRNLQGMQTSFGRLLEEVRRELAEHYIDDRSVSLMEIAFICGYSVYSSFSRAYKRWTGVSPTEKRKQLKGFFKSFKKKGNYMGN